LVYKEPSYTCDAAEKTLNKDDIIMASGEIYKAFDETSFIFKKF